MTVAENPAQPKKIETSVKIEPLAQQAVAKAGERLTLRFRALDLKTGTRRKQICKM
jgi:hypothetical protein